MYDRRLEEAFWRSCTAESTFESSEDLVLWIEERNKETPVSIERIGLSQCHPWYYDKDKGSVVNDKGAFFSISGMRAIDCNDAAADSGWIEQPIILQNEIGFLGILCKEFDGVMHFLMQAKIEPGNVNKVQISPTIQATKSNFTRAHGGAEPAYLKYFTEVNQGTVIADQIQSEQSSRFLGKRNRNVILFVEEEIDVLPSHKWMTLAQIKHLMRFDNLINMDTRTVISSIPWSFFREPKEAISSNSLVASMLTKPQYGVIGEVYRCFNDYKMFSSPKKELVPLDDLTQWSFDDFGIKCKKEAPFEVIFCDIQIEGREVVRWSQPLFKPNGRSFFGLLVCMTNDELQFLVKAKPEIGCFDGVELSPTLQIEASVEHETTFVEEVFFDYLKQGKGVLADVILSEEGGRFFCEENRNVIIALDTCPDDLNESSIPSDYFWMNYSTLCHLMKVNNVLNIQLRNLLSILDVRSVF